LGIGEHEVIQKNKGEYWVGRIRWVTFEERRKICKKKSYHEDL
jgi:hypothetical protein